MLNIYIFSYHKQRSKITKKAPNSDTLNQKNNKAFLEVM